MEAFYESDVTGKVTLGRKSNKFWVFSSGLPTKAEKGLKIEVLERANCFGKISGVGV